MSTEIQCPHCGESMATGEHRNAKYAHAPRLTDQGFVVDWYFDGGYCGGSVLFHSRFKARAFADWTNGLMITTDYQRIPQDSAAVA